VPASFYILQIASTLSVLLPLSFAVCVFKRMANTTQVFFVLLLIGLSTDLAGWYFYLSKNASLNIVVRHGYNLIEPTIVFWILYKLSPFRIIKLIFPWAWLALFFFWGLSIAYKVFELYKITTEIVIAFTSCFCLLHLVEHTSPASRQLNFWILLGFFFYNFSTFFFMGFLSSQIGFNLWYLHNIINIITNIIFEIGFWRIREAEPSSQ